MRPIVIRMKLDQLDDFIRNRAHAGDIAMARDPSTEYEYVCLCKEEHISGKVKPFWSRLDERALWKAYFDNMTLEQKVDYLIDEYINKHA
jgi:hypothetical protein